MYVVTESHRSRARWSKAVYLMADIRQREREMMKDRDRV